MDNVRHSSESMEWGTAPSYTVIAKSTLGEITVDPFSSAHWNRFVGAKHFGSKTPEDGGTFDGFVGTWVSGGPSAAELLAGRGYPAEAREPANTALVNAPGDARGVNVQNAWRLLSAYYELGWLAGGAVWVGFNLNQFQTLQFPETFELDRESWQMVYSPLVGLYRRIVPSRRQAFLSHPDRPARPAKQKDGSIKMVKDDAPSHPSFILLMPALDDAVAEKQIEIFSEMGYQLGEVF